MVVQWVYSEQRCVCLPVVCQQLAEHDQVRETGGKEDNGHENHETVDAPPSLVNKQPNE